MSEQLYLRKNDNGYELIVQDFDEKRIPIKEEYLFKEAAVVVLYPDGLIDAVPINNEFIWHVDYYKELVTKSPRFASLSKSFPKGWRGEYNMSPVNKVMVNMGTIVIQNIDITNLPEEYVDREDFYSTFLFYGTNQLTQELQSNLDMIFDNYPNERCHYSKINKKTKEFDEEEVGKKR